MKKFPKTTPAPNLGPTKVPLQKGLRASQSRGKAPNPIKPSSGKKPAY